MRISYGFITFVNEADAVKAVETLDKSEIDGRQINVEMAKPATAPTPRAPRAPAAEPVLGEDGLPVKRPSKNNRAVIRLPLVVSESLPTDDSTGLTSERPLPPRDDPEPTQRLRKLATLPSKS